MIKNSALEYKTVCRLLAIKTPDKGIAIPGTYLPHTCKQRTALLVR